jgi:hypothetical protein
MGSEQRLKDLGPTELAAIREANFPTVNESDGWPAATWTINDSSLEMSGEGGDDDPARLNASVMFHITQPSGSTAVPMHLELLEVTNDEDGFQTAVQFDGVYESLCGVYEPDGRYQTITFGGREYIAYYVPHSE